MDIEQYLGELTRKARADDHVDDHQDVPVRKANLESVLKGQTVELWSDSMGSLFLVADDADAQRVMERYGVLRGSVYTAGEIHYVTSVGDPEVVAEIHNWKRTMNARIKSLSKAPERLSPDAH